MDFDIKFEGLDKLIGKIEDFDDVHAMTRAMQDACNIVVGAAIDKAPKKTGALRRSITSKVELTGNSIEGIVFTPLEYAPYQEYGTGLFAENGNGRKTGWAYEDEKTGETIFTRGNRPHPFLRPAVNENKDKIINIIKGALK